MDIAESILYEDTDILVCRKPAGVAVQTKRLGEQDMESLLRNYQAGRGKTPYIGIVHRLDQPVEGIMVFALNPKAAAALNRQMQNGGFGKYYLAVLTGHLSDKSGTFTDYLQKDGKKNTSSVVCKSAPNAKKAILHYEILQELQEESLVKIKLETGRHHQIRVQMAHAGCPLAGDGKYAASCPGSVSKTAHAGYSVREVGIGLCSFRIEFCHPISGKEMRFEIEPEGARFHKFASLKSIGE